MTSLIAANRCVSAGFSFMAIFISAMITVTTMHDQPRTWKDWKDSGPLYLMSLWDPCSWSLTRFFAITVFLLGSPVFFFVMPYHLHG